MFQIHDGPLKVDEILSYWNSKIDKQNFGAMITFIGTVRDENGIDGLSFDIYEPLLKSWFNSWQEKVKKDNVVLFLAHSNGDVPNHKSSYISAVASPQRKIALKIINDFVEDFKAQAPIWKYDIIERKRVYAKDRSTQLLGAGLLK